MRLLGGSAKKNEKFKDWKVGQKYLLEKFLGQGSYGQVVQAVQLTTGKRVAIKRMINLFEDATDCKRMLRELVILRQVQHPFVVNLIDVVIQGDHTDFNEIYLIMEFCESDLKKLFKSSL